jgi:tetratricopeptide (TPR) repeat protein
MRYGLITVVASVLAIASSSAVGQAGMGATLHGIGTLPFARPDYMVPPTDPLGRPWPPSAWRDNEKLFYADLLAKGRFDVLVVPFQVQVYELGRATRSLMTAQLAMAIQESAPVKVADPYLVWRALGEGNRRFEVREVYALAKRLGVKRVVLGYVGRETDAQAALLIQVWEPRGLDAPGPNNAERPLQLPTLARSDQTPSIAGFQRLLADVVKALGYEPKPSSAAATASRPPAKLPTSPKDFSLADRDPVRDAYSLQLLAVLAPAQSDRVRERFWEKSFLAASRIAQGAESRRILLARAYANFGMRPAALDVLGTPQSPEAKYLLEVLNGNLPAARALVPKIPAGAPQLIAQLEVNEIGAAYEVLSQDDSLRSAKALQLPSKAWSYLFGRAYVDWDLWAQFDNLSLKAVLDVDFPIRGFSAADLIKGAETLSDADRLQSSAYLAVFEHVRRVLSESSANWCCGPLVDAPTALDYIDLAQGIGTDNLMRRAYFLNEVQGSPKAALDFLSQIELVYKDHPRFALERARAEGNLARTVDSASKKALIRSAATYACDAYYWEQGQTPAAADALRVAGSLAGVSGLYLQNFYSVDMPYRSFFPSAAVGASPDITMRNALARLRNSTTDFEPVRDLAFTYELTKQPEKFDELMHSIEKRFAGHPRRPQMLAKSRLSKGDAVGAEHYFQEAIQAQPGVWRSYLQLGALLFEQGSAKRAAEVFSQYLGFAPGAQENRVAIANNAYDAGNIFYWTGEFDYARPFYKRAADLNTGSDASLASELRLDLLDGDLATAGQLMLARAQRYNSSYAYRDYFGLLHAMGQSERAWAGFNVLIAQHPAPHIWETAVVGQRMAGLTEGQVFDWAKQDAMRKAGAIVGYASLHLLRTATMDRMPPANLAEQIAEIERPVWQLPTLHNYTVRVHGDGSGETVLGPSIREGSTLAIGAFARVEKSRVPSDLVRFARADRAMQTGDFAAAATELHEASKQFDISNETLGYLLPYYAYAAARAGRPAEVAEYLAHIPPNKQRFDYYLAKGVLEAIAGQHDAALAHLRDGLRRRPYTEYRPVLVEYQYGELCDWLRSATGDARYGREALDWARKTQRLQPWFAWSYALEAKYAADRSARGRAIAIAYYLDKNSQWLGSLPRAEVETAVREYGKQNPLKLEPSPSRRQDT